MSLVKRHTLDGCGVCACWWRAALAVFVPGCPRLRWIFLVVAGAVLLLASLALNAGEARGALGRRTTRYGAGAAVMVLLALGVVVVANALSSRHSVRWDFTENRRNSCRRRPIQVLRTLKTPVEAIAFFRPTRRASAPRRTCSTSTRRNSGGKFTWRLEDTDKAPGPGPRVRGRELRHGRAQEGGPDAGRRARRRFSTPRRRSSPTPSSRSRARGSGSCTCSRGTASARSANTERAGFSQARDQMEKANYEVKELVLAREAKVPDDAAVVIVPGPKTDLFPQEIAALDAYIARGGKAFFMATPFSGRGPPRRTSRSTASSSTTTWSSS